MLSLQIRFKAKKDVDILTRLHSNNENQTGMNQYIVHQRVKDQIIINAKLPEAGNYLLQVYAKERGKEGTFPLLCSYLITSYNASIDPTPYSHIANSRLGPTDQNSILQITPKSHQSALIVAPHSGEFQVIMNTPTACEVTSYLEWEMEGTQEKKKVKTFQHKSEKELSIHVRIPESRTFTLKIFGKKSGDPGTTQTNIYNYIIEASYPCPKYLPFPRAFNKWSTGCKLIEPTNGILPSNHPITFSVVVPNAGGVALIAADKKCEKKRWTYLTKKTDGTWIGDVITGDDGEELTLGAILDPKNKTNYPSLLEFQVC